MVIVLLFTSSLMYGEKVAVLEEISRPASIAVDNTQLYVVEGTTIFIYSLKNYKLIKKFGKAGEGPMEFRQFATVTPHENKLIINSAGKVSFYSTRGKYQREIKGKGGFNFIFLPLKDKFVAFGITAENSVTYRTVNLFDSQLNKIKEITRYKNFFQPGKKLNPMEVQGKTYQTLDDKIIIDDFDGTFQVIDQAGQLVKSFKPTYQKYKLTDKHKEAILESYKTNPQTRRVYEQVKHLVEFPPYFPPVQGFITADKSIYIHTYRRQGNTAEFFVYDINGKLMKHTWVPFFDITPQAPHQYAILNGKIYQIYENVDDEEWELHINKIL